METRTEQAHTAKQHSTGFNGVLRRSCTHLFTFIYGTELLHPFGFGHYCSLELPAEAASMRERGSRLSVSQPAACLLGVVRAQGPRYGSPLSHSAVQCAWCGCRRRGGRATNHSGYHHLIMAEWSSTVVYHSMHQLASQTAGFRFQRAGSSSSLLPVGTEPGRGGREPRRAAGASFLGR